MSKVSMRKPVSLAKNLKKADARDQLFRAELGRILRSFDAAVASTGAVSLTRGVPMRAAA